MKKSLIALAALAATSAFAQSSVTLYGRAEAGVDLGFRSTTNGTTVTAPVLAGVAQPVTSTNAPSSVSKPGFRVQDGNNQGLGSSRFGMRGTEDLGGGLKANFVMEAGLNLDDGSTGNGGGNFFSRAAWVGLSGGFGEVRLGRQVLGSFGVHANGLALSAASGLYETGATVAQGGVRFSNAIQYRSPDFGGISGTVSLSAPENNSSVTTGAATSSTTGKTGVDLSVAYANGPIYVGFGYNKQNTTSATNNGLPGLANVTTSTAGPRTDYTLSASYNFGVAQPFFNYTNRKDRSNSSTVTGGVVTAIGGTSLVGSGVNTNGRQYALGVKVPLGAATLVTSFGTHKTTGAANDLANANNSSVERKVRAFQVGGLYPLSKRTTLMANYGINNLKDATRSTVLLGAGAGSTVTVNSETKVRGLNVGVQHLF
jgi:predicted porin